MRKRILIPGAALGGIAVYLASQFLSLDVGDLSVPKETNTTSVQERSSEPSVIAPESADDVRLQTAVESPSANRSEMLLLIDVVIDGDRYLVSRVTSMMDVTPRTPREPGTLEEIIPMISEAKGDQSGTRVRVSRTAEAVASAETRLMDALNKAGISVDEIDNRSRLVE